MLRQGEPIDVWIVDRPLGHGGFGSVYRCHNSSAARILAAVKVLDESLRRSDEAKARFILEAEILYGLDHPNIVKVRNVRMDGPTPYLEMEFVDGIDLERRLRRGPIPLAEALPLFEQVADALAYLHRQGVRHRDVKPGNIVVRADGSLKLVDFGIATEGDGTLPNGTENAFGSVAYVPPEWLSTTGIDHVRWDVYSAGLVFWEALTGRDAFPVQDSAGLSQEVARILEEKKRTDALALPGFPPSITALVADMTRSAPAERVGSFEEVRERLAAVRAEVIRPPPRRPVLPSLGRASPVVAFRPAGAVPTPILPVPARRRDRPGGPTTRPHTRGARDTLVPEPAPGLPPRAARPAVTLSVVPPSAVPPSSVPPSAVPPPAVPPAPSGPTWRSSIPGASLPMGDDPSFAVATSRRTAWIEVRWSSPARFTEWCASQLLNYTLLLPRGGDVLPTRGPIRVLLSHDDVQIDCPAQVQAQGPTSVSYRLELDFPQVELLRKWLGTCAAGGMAVCL